MDSKDDTEGLRAIVTTRWCDCLSRSVTHTGLCVGLAHLLDPDSALKLCQADDPSKQPPTQQQAAVELLSMLKEVLQEDMHSSKPGEPGHSEEWEEDSELPGFEQ